MHFRKNGIKSGIYLQKIGIKLSIHFGKIGIRNGYGFETSMTHPRPKSGQVPPPPPGFGRIKREFAVLVSGQLCSYAFCIR